jgi:hypothetical protein
VKPPTGGRCQQHVETRHQRRVIDGEDRGGDPLDSRGKRAQAQAWQAVLTDYAAIDTQVRLVSNASVYQDVSGGGYR